MARPGTIHRVAGAAPPAPLGAAMVVPLLALRDPDALPHLAEEPGEARVAHDQEFVLSHVDGIQAAGVPGARRAAPPPRPSGRAGARPGRGPGRRRTSAPTPRDEGTERLIGRARLKALATPSHRMPFASRGMPMPSGWSAGCAQVTAACLTLEDRPKAIDRGPDDTTSAVSIRRLFQRTAGVATALPPHTRVEGPAFEDHPFAPSKAAGACALCGDMGSDLREMIVGDAGERPFACSDTDRCERRREGAA